MPYKPAVSGSVLILVAGVVWMFVGSALLFAAYAWLSKAPDLEKYLSAGAGVALALAIHHLGFLRIVDRNLERIQSADGKRCVFSFIPWRSYLVIAAMVGLGTVLRHSPMPREYLAAVYTGIGLALVLSSVRYARVFLRELKRRPPA